LTPTGPPPDTPLMMATLPTPLIHGPCEENEGKHELMITLEEYARNELVRQGNANPTRVRRELNLEFPLRCFARCVACDQPVAGSWSGGRTQRYAYYHCRTRGGVEYGKAIPKTDLEAHCRSVNLKVPSRLANRINGLRDTRPPAHDADHEDGPR
ncbi:MAG: hypothetical protein ACE5JN_13365, partial [Candidatus Methylomirabilia bacterium]